MRVLVFESSTRGHRLPYVRRLLGPVAELVNEVVVCLPRDAPETREFDLEMRDRPKNVSIDASLPESRSRRLNNIRTPFEKIHDYRERILEHRPDRVYIPNADGFAQAWGVIHTVLRKSLYRVPLEGLLMRGSFAYERSGWGARTNASISKHTVLRGPWHRLFLLDPIVLEAMRQYHPNRNALHLLPDPAEPDTRVSLAEARSALSLPPGRYIGCVGTISHRKGIDLFLDAFAHAKLAREDRLLLVGEHTQSIRDLIANRYASLLREERLISIDRFVTSRELQLAYRALDLVCTPYPDHIGSASIVIGAAAAERCVLGSDFGWIAKIVRTFDLGRITNVRNRDDFALAIERGLEEAPSFQLTEAGRRFVAYHTTSNFVATWMELLRQQMGLEPDPRQVHWEWVCEALTNRQLATG